MPSLRWKCKRTFSSHTTKTATVKCLPPERLFGGSFSTGLGYTRPTAGYGITEGGRRRRNICESSVGGREEDLMSGTPVNAFSRYDETPDEEFYIVPRLVTHINAQNYKTA
jgi:hypothetical protein